MPAVRFFGKAGQKLDPTLGSGTAIKSAEQALANGCHIHFVRGITPLRDHPSVLDDHQRGRSECLGLQTGRIEPPRRPSGGSRIDVLPRLGMGRTCNENTDDKQPCESSNEHSVSLYNHIVSIQ